MLVKIRTDYEDSPWIAAGKIYEAVLVKTGRYAGMYKFIGELGSPCYTRLERSIHIGGKDWEIVE
ncbi:hypothetical protein bas11_0078 [Escherichia phage JohannLBurckhardt]|uniref:Uncharacterized protein n=1 Tax=Escherichia phage JohannLBurckhardt TaxID=2851975 RepID=A0AAE8B134_9CAUD|nr:hypothetical protein bas11_0078 [Escherichia phage JohannLBurckhardt]